MDVRLCVLRRFELDDEVNIRNIKASGGHVGGNENLELAVSESLEGDLSLTLRNVSVENLDFVFEMRTLDDFVGLLFSLGKDNGFSFQADVDEKEVGEGGESVVLWASDGEMLDIFGGLVLEVSGEVEIFVASIEEFFSHSSNPSRHGGAEHDELRGMFLSDFVHKPFDVFLESHVHHLVCLIKDDSLDPIERDVSSLHMVQHSSSSSHEELNSSSELVCLGMDRDTSINGQNLVFLVVVLELLELRSDLLCQLSGRSKHDGSELPLALCSLKHPFGSQLFNQW